MGEKTAEAMKETVTITKEEYERLLFIDRAFTLCLRHGVEDWEGWDDVVNILYAE